MGNGLSTEPQVNQVLDNGLNNLIVKVGMSKANCQESIVENNLGVVVMPSNAEPA